MLKAIIVDDEAPARKRLAKLLAPHVRAGQISIEAEAVDGFDALSQLQESKFDLMFLDVQMPELNGFDVLERLAEEARPVVIFTTAFDEYAVKAFEASAIDYLLKPVDKKRLADAVSRAERLVGQSESRSEDDERIAMMLDWLEKQADYGKTEKVGADQYLKQLSVPYRDRLVVVPVDHIVSAEVRDGITRLMVLEDRPNVGSKNTEYIVSYTLEQLEANLDPELFMRVHRSAIVRLDTIKEMVTWFSGRLKLVLTGGHEVIASRERSKLLRQRMSI
jgi:two-component system LytT family response regulator